MSWLREPDTEPILGYRLISPLGTGGFGEVWKCIAPGGIEKAIKFVYGNLNSSEDAERADQEYRALNRVKEVRHPFVLQMDRIEVVSGELLIVMELADRSLHDVLVEHQSNQQTGLPRELLLRYLHDAAEGLDYLIEKHNLQHLDVKPRNLFVVADRVKVADFGLVKHIERQSSAGLMGGVSPLYAAPETFVSKVSRHSDQYSLAIVYVELLKGVRPFSGKNIRQLAMQHISAPPDLSMLNDADQQVVARALAKNPDERFPSCQAFIRALMAATPGFGDPARVSNWSLSIASLGDSRAELFAPPVPGSGSHRAPRRAALEPDDDGAVSLELTTNPPEEMANWMADSPVNWSMPSMSTTSALSSIGVLRPTILIGLGNFGRRALLEFRCRLLDRVGDLKQMPIFRFLYLDSDPEAGVKAANATPEIAMDEDHLLHIPLQPVSSYRRRHLDQLVEWIPAQKLYAIPRTLQPLDSRALGRLAFGDHYLRIVNRLKREIQVATHPESLMQSLSHSGLPLRDATPRVLIFADASSGSGGPLMDLGCAVRRVLDQLGHPKGRITPFVFCGAPEDPATPPMELANVYASIQELQHFSDPSVPFHAHYGAADGPKFQNESFPFSGSYLIALEHRSPGMLRDAMARLSTYLLQELTTPLGNDLEVQRRRALEQNQTIFRCFGSFSVWFPRGLLLREAARQVGAAMVAEWQSRDILAVRPMISEYCQRLTHEPAFQTDAIRFRLVAELANRTDGSAEMVIQRLLQQLEEQAAAALNENPGEWLRQAMDRIREVIGLRHGTEAESIYRSSRIGQMIAEASSQIALDWNHHLLERAIAWMDQPGPRLAMAEESVRRLMEFADHRVAELAWLAQERSMRAQQARAEVQAALDAYPKQAGFRLFGSRAGRILRVFLDQVREFAELRYREELEHGIVDTFRRLRAHLEERLGDLSFCRQRLTHFQQTLMGNAATIPHPLMNPDRVPSSTPSMAVDPLHEALRGSDAVRVVLPRGEAEVHEAAAAFVSRLGPDHFSRLEELIQSLVLTPLGGLFRLCQQSTDLMIQLSAPLLDQTAVFLSELLPVTDAAQVEYSSSVAREVDLRAELASYFEASSPAFAGERQTQRAYLVVPASPAGEWLGKIAQQSAPELRVVPAVAHTTDLVICRESDFLRLADLEPILQTCRRAYREYSTNPALSPHSRFDILSWASLED
ncbi:protein kinase domain-containing protein [Tuwongella immobilis]|uniref:Protein kinase domain-containing protein n=1 Tax=Tuwongella immobilis TaxID=692036 RepID=A0A6C2YKW2_9BACT|nr:protein kinase [Tuwongella immobilis]VIP01941.1 serine threonine protein kinase : Serine/threonine protein kinase OS=Pirellula staleyi (strain ATCC 27377 / DSM 6068 / ICPB 4128) GN=Psta_0486 PE=4 SV=1: Pkinase: Tubulin_2 [Tuwongella immobilis]VTR99911.1 serine threonine protein kinase : Serine/threonine protein kinase OS=Pirellula staleyi (strain ATCC 27377 / DSM 6068 / ICPB 4128) GN=Psta_0486 PE=4 SV=1: Pkinase: Tubulin_2 [Tuwongella immobilis]